jgi:hypothetical protein
MGWTAAATCGFIGTVTEKNAPAARAALGEQPSRTPVGPHYHDPAASDAASGTFSPRTSRLLPWIFV